MDFYSNLLKSGLLNGREWNMFYANPVAWKSLRLVAITFGEE